MDTPGPSPVPGLGAAQTRWPVVAWIRLVLPPRPAPTVLLGPPPQPEPPFDWLEPNPVATDPRRRIYAHEEPLGEQAVVRLIWDTDDPGLLEAELRAPMPGKRPPVGLVDRFWEAVRRRTSSLGPLRVDGADPRPGPVHRPG